METPVPKSDVGSIRDPPKREVLGRRNGGEPGQSPGGGRRTRIQGVSGVGDQPPISPKGGLDYFLRKSIVILASSENAGSCEIGL